MLSHDQLIELCREAGVTSDGLAYIERVRDSEPARRVGGTRFRSVSARFASAKMGRSIQAESRTCEFPLVLALELDQDVEEYFDQPEPICLRRCRNGKNRVDTYTPDFLVIRRNAIEIIEAKLHAKVVELAGAHPDEWGMRDGHWIYLPAAEHFDRMRIRHRVHLAEDINSTRAANLALLLGAKSSPQMLGEDAAWKKAGSTLSAGKPVTIDRLAEQLRLPDVSAVLRWIAFERVFFAIDHQRLAETRTARVFGTAAARDAFVMALTVERGVHLAPEQYDLSSRVSLTERQTELALQRREATFAALRSATLSRQQRRYMREYRRAEARGEDLLAPFVPRFERRGNWNSRLTQEQKSIIADAIERLYATPARRSARWVHSGIFWGDAPSVSYATFCSILKTYAKGKLANQRSGHRASMAVQPPSAPALRSQMPSVAWELVHIDHTKLDEKVWVQTGLEQILDRPCISIAIDAWSKCVLSFWIGFSSPSAETLLMLVRDCVRRHGRLARGWISDHGTEFGSVSWEKFCAAHGCTKFERPVAHPRSGSEIENLFGQLNTGLIHQLDGNMRNDQDWRSASSSHKSEATARFSLEQVYSKIEFFLFDHYNKRPHGPQLFAPLAGLQQSATDFGDIVGIRQDFDHAFRVETAIPTKQRRLTIDSRRGIRLQDRAYWHPALGEPTNDSQRVEVRREPFDSSIIYAHVKGTWLTCVDARHPRLRCLDELSRWAQTSLDISGRAYARASKRQADERFARTLQERWDVQGAERPESSVAIPPIATPTRTGQETTDEKAAGVPSAFAALRDQTRSPLREVDS